MPTVTTATCMALRSCRAPDWRAALLPEIDSDEISRIASDGSLRRDDPRSPGIADLVVTIRDAQGGARAALTVPYVTTSFSEVDVENVRLRAVDAADVITARLTPTSDDTR